MSTHVARPPHLGSSLRTIRFGTVLLVPSTQTVLRGGQPVRVTHTEFRLLLALMRRRGAIASRLELLREV